MHGFVKLRRGIVEHLKDNQITADEYTVYSLIILLADHRSGSWLGCAIAVSRLTHWSTRQSQRVLHSLRSKGYITGEPSSGRGQYLIRVTKYFKKATPHSPSTKKKATPQSHLPPEGDSPVALSAQKATPQSPLQEELLNQQEEHIQEGAKIAPPRELPGFALFWEGYPTTPHKLDRDGALKQWLSKVRIDADWLPVLEGLERWKASGRWDDSQYIPNPAKFLYRKQWLMNPPANGGSHVITPRQQKSKATSTSLSRVFGGPEVRAGAYGGDDGPGTNRIADHGVPGGADGNDSRANPRGIQEGKKDITLFPKAYRGAGIGARGN